MVVIDIRQEGLTWVWMDSNETTRVRGAIGHTYTAIHGKDEAGRRVAANLRDDEIIQTITQGDIRGILMNRVTAMLNGLHAG